MQKAEPSSASASQTAGAAAAGGAASSPVASSPESFHLTLSQLPLFADLAAKTKKIWNLPGQDEKAPTPNSLEVFACNHFLEIFFVDEGRLKILNLKRLKQRPDPKQPPILSVELSPPPSYPMFQILVDESGDAVALIGKHAVSVVEMTRRDRSELLEKKPVMCKVRAFGSYYFSTHPSVSILKAAFHPLSSKHLLVLSSDNTLRLYHLAREDRSTEDPEQIVSLQLSNTNATPNVTMTPSRAGSSTSGPKAVTFCFGPPRKGLWGRLTVWILYDNGDIYALCPFIPIGCLLPVAVLDELALLTDQQLQQLQMAEYEVQPQLFDHFEAQRAWLQQIRGPVVASSKEDRADDIAGEPEWLRTKAPPSNLLIPYLQGPLNSDRGGNNSTSSTSTPSSGAGNLLMPSDLVCLDLVPTVLLRLDRSGVVDSFVLFEGEIDGAWPQSSAISRRQDLVLVDSIDLSFRQAGAKKTVGETLPVIRPDSLYADLVYVVHSSGISRVRLNWLGRIISFIDSQDSSAQGAGELVPGTANSLVALTNLSGQVANQPLLQPVLCTCIISDSTVGHLLLALYTRLVIVDLTASSALDIQPPLKISSKDSTPSGSGIHVGAKPGGADPLKAQRPPMVQIHIPQPEEVSLTSADTLALMMKMTKQLNDRYLVYVYNLNGETKARVERVNQFKQAQQEELAELSNILQVQEQNQAQLREKIELLATFQNDITARLDTILEIINSHQQNLSNEELDYHRELEQSNEKLSLLSTKLEEVKRKSERVNVAQQQSQIHLSDTQLARIEPILSQEQSMIQSAVEAVKKLRIELDELQPSAGQ